MFSLILRLVKIGLVMIVKKFIYSLLSKKEAEKPVEWRWTNPANKDDDKSDTK